MLDILYFSNNTNDLKMRGINRTPTFTLTLGWEKIHNTNILCGYHWIKIYVVSPENGTFCLNNDSFLLKT